MPVEYDKLGSLALAIIAAYPTSDAIPSRIHAALAYAESALHDRNEEHIGISYALLVAEAKRHGMEELVTRMEEMCR